MMDAIRKLWAHEAGQEIAEYAVLSAVILVLVVGTQIAEQCAPYGQGRDSCIQTTDHGDCPDKELRVDAARR